MAAFTCGEAAGPSTTISTGFMSPPENWRSSTANACLASKSLGSVSTPETPVFIPSSGEAASRRTPTPITMATTGRRMALWAIRDQADAWPLARRSMRRRPRNGSLSRLTRVPRSLSTAGSSVSAASTAIATTRMAPAPRLVNMVFGTSSIPSKARTTVIPLKNTARPAVSLAAETAWSLERPRASSSRKRDTMNRV